MLKKAAQPRHRVRSMGALLIPAARSTVRQIRPLEDPRWDEFVCRSRNSSIFHTRAWLEALHRTYGYEPVAFTTSHSGGPIENCLLFCRVKSRLTGNRLVSLPFSDHCAPLVNDLADMQCILSAVECEVLRDKMNYLELRLLSALQADLSLPRSECSYYLHKLDLTPELDTLFRSFHKDCTQRKIRRAEREGLTYEEGRSDSLLDVFYRLLLITRRRRRVPPQPKRWFQNLADCLGDQLEIRVASTNGRPAAAMLTLRHKNTLVYKYGGSDARFHHLGAMHLLFWRCIQEAKREGLQVLDLGRSNVGDAGLVMFKDRWGSAVSTMTYSRHGIPGRFEYRPDETWKEQIAKYVVSCLPEYLFKRVGQLLYRHVG